MKANNSRSLLKRYFIKFGCIAWLLWLGLLVVIIALHKLGIINGYKFPLNHVSIFLCGGGTICLIVGWLLPISKKKIYAAVLSLFIFLFILSYVIEYNLTCFRSPGHFGGLISKPINSRTPANIGLKYVTHRISINKSEWLEAWLIPSKYPSPKGTVVLFPGNGNSKGGQLLPPAQVFNYLNYDCFLVDFRGVGGSSGNTTTVGMREAKDVAIAVNYLSNLQHKPPLVLYGVSMGSAAILRAIAYEGVKPNAIILELPFARLLNGVKSRLNFLKIPSFPLAEMILFWGGVQFKFNPFMHNPVDYASFVTSPTLVLQGKKDKWTTVAEVEELYQNLRGTKQLVIFPNAGHQLLVSVDKKLWYERVDNFLKKI